VVPLGQGLKARGNVERWLAELEARMAAALRRAARAAVAAYAEVPRAQWVLQHPGQLVIAASQVGLPLPAAAARLLHLA
jgi:dynein heavy chain